MIETLLNNIETEWERVAAKVIADIVVSHPDETFYGAGFWSFYADYTVIGGPAFAMNTEAHIADDPSNRWIPPNWKFDNISAAGDETNGPYQQLSEALAGEPEDRWRHAIEEHKQLVARVCRKVTAAVHGRAGAFASLSLPSSFVVGIFEEKDGIREYDRLAQLSIDESLIQSLDLPDSKKAAEKMKRLMARRRRSAD